MVRVMGKPIKGRVVKTERKRCDNKIKNITLELKKIAHGASTASVFTNTLITRVQLKMTCATAKIYSYIFSVLGGGHIKSLWERKLVTPYFEWLIFHLKNTHSIEVSVQ